MFFSKTNYGDFEEPTVARKRSFIVEDEFDGEEEEGFEGPKLREDTDVTMGEAITKQIYISGIHVPLVKHLMKKELLIEEISFSDIRTGSLETLLKKYRRETETGWGNLAEIIAWIFYSFFSSRSVLFEMKTVKHKIKKYIEFRTKTLSHLVYYFFEHVWKEFYLDIPLEGEITYAKFENKWAKSNSNKVMIDIVNNFTSDKYFHRFKSIESLRISPKFNRVILIIINSLIFIHNELVTSSRAKSGKKLEILYSEVTSNLELYVPPSSRRTPLISLSMFLDIDKTMLKTYFGKNSDIGLTLSIGGLLYTLSEELYTRNFEKSNEIITQYLFYNVLKDPHTFSNIKKKYKPLGKKLHASTRGISTNSKLIDRVFLTLFSGIQANIIINSYEHFIKDIKEVKFRELGTVTTGGDTVGVALQRFLKFLEVRYFLNMELQTFDKKTDNFSSKDFKEKLVNGIASFAGINDFDIFYAYGRIVSQIFNTFPKLEDDERANFDAKYYLHNKINDTLNRLIKDVKNVSKIYDFIRAFMQVEHYGLSVTLAKIRMITPLLRNNLFETPVWFKTWIILSVLPIGLVKATAPNIDNYKVTKTSTLTDLCTSIIKPMKNYIKPYISPDSDTLMFTDFCTRRTLLRKFVSKSFMIHYAPYISHSYVNKGYNRDSGYDETNPGKPYISSNNSFLLTNFTIRLPLIQEPFILSLLRSKNISLGLKKAIIKNDSPNLLISRSVVLALPTWTAFVGNEPETLVDALANLYGYVDLLITKEERVRNELKVIKQIVKTWYKQFFARTKKDKFDSIIATVSTEESLKEHELEIKIIIHFKTVLRVCKSIFSRITAVNVYSKTFTRIIEYLFQKDIEKVGLNLKDVSGVILYRNKLDPAFSKLYGNSINKIVELIKRDAKQFDGSGGGLLFNFAKFFSLHKDESWLDVWHYKSMIYALFPSFFDSVLLKGALSKGVERWEGGVKKAEPPIEEFDLMKSILNSKYHNNPTDSTKVIILHNNCSNKN